MSITTLVRGPGRRRAVDRIPELKADNARLTEERDDARQQREYHWQQILAGDEALRLMQARAEAAEARARRAEADTRSALERTADLQVVCDRQAAELRVLNTRIANLTGTSLGAPIDAHPEVFGDATVPTNVTTLRSRRMVVLPDGAA